MLGGIFIALLVSCNLIFLKFISWEMFNSITITISVGLIPYPLTFLVTDLISEIYGEKRANDVVKVGLVCAIFVIALTYVADIIPADSQSPVNDEQFHRVFGLAGISVTASMIAYLLAQFIDIKIYHFWKRLTKGKHLWLRNNFSTLTSQLIDTVTVLVLLCAFNALDWAVFWTIFTSSFLWKVIVAAGDTPFLYLFVFIIKKHFNLEVNQEIDLNKK
ncbi:MAG: queuosine precursor transporter [Crocinitomicaceae bacterium]|nr:queuosine precursor transporter [Crocinitomicaceae bacterium]